MNNSSFHMKVLFLQKPGVLVQIISKLIKVANCCRSDYSSHMKFWKFGIISNEDLKEILDYRLPDEEFNATT